MDVETDDTLIDFSKKKTQGRKNTNYSLKSMSTNKSEYQRGAAKNKEDKVMEYRAEIIIKK